YISIILKFIRYIYRLVENATGTTIVDLENIEALESLSPILRYEVLYFYIFEASLMLVKSMLWNVRHPGPHLPQDYHIYLKEDGNEVKGEKNASDCRPFLLNLANNLFCGMLFRDKAVTKPESCELNEQRRIDGRRSSSSV
ncbi:hypothetical protein F5883DRAFT_437706, partial [Diaporthe sp. PMI_573]